ncbi:MAG: hypothetical protein AMS23_10425 [Bacteroides sp. SM1_62]|nr:MAG: hypothetical protein AMS23_10425 [Bacteroides sp. SM1_62]
MKKKVVIPALFLIGIMFSAHGQYDEYMKKIGQSERTSYVMYTDNNGNLYYVNIENHFLDLMKYDIQSDQVIKIADNFIDDHLDNGSVYNEGFGSIAPTITGDTVYCMTTAGTNHGNADIFRLICSRDTLEHVTGICGTNVWKIFNMTLSKDSKTLYYIGNNTSSGKALYKIELETLQCTNILDLDPIIPHRDLCFGGINVWDNYDNFYLPVWSWDYDPGDLAMLQVHIGEDEYSAKVIEFTDDGSSAGDRLLPGFRHHSCWSGIGASSKGNIYIGASNHYQSSTGTGEHGNVAIYKWDPVNEEMTLLGDLKSVSEAVNNWMTGESQHKVHTFIIENADGKMYFATDDYYPSHFIRGSHVYTIDIETDELVDYSKTQSYVMKRDFSVVENGDVASSTSGVFAEYYGIKGISLNPKTPEVLYAMTFSNPDGVANPGYIIKHQIDSDFSTAINLNTPLSNPEINIYPNPFTDHISFDCCHLKLNEQPVLRIFDLYGRLLLEEKGSNDQVLTWNGKNMKGLQVPCGLYIYSIEIKGKIISGKIMRQ